MQDRYKIILSKDGAEKIDIHYGEIVERLKSGIDFNKRDYLFLYWNSGSSPTLSLFEKVDDEIWDRVPLMFDIDLLRICSRIYKKVDQGRVFALSIYIYSDGRYEGKLYDDLNPINSWSNLYIIAYKEYGAKLPILKYTGTNLERLLERENFKESIFYAVYHRNLDRVRELIDSSPLEEINYFVKTIGTPLHIASKNGDFEIVKLLVEAGAELDSESYLGKSALLEAISHGHEDIARFLIENGSDIHKISMEESNALELAVVNDLSIEFISYLIKIGCNVDRIGFDGIDLLSIAVYKKDMKLINLLVASGIDQKLVNNALDIAKEEKKGFTEIINILSH